MSNKFVPMMGAGFPETCTPGAFIVNRVTGEVAVDVSSASRKQLRGGWAWKPLNDFISGSNPRLWDIREPGVYFYSPEYPMDSFVTDAPAAITAQSKFVLCVYGLSTMDTILGGNGGLSSSLQVIYGAESPLSIPSSHMYTRFIDRESMPDPSMSMWMESIACPANGASYVKLATVVSSEFSPSSSSYEPSSTGVGGTLTASFLTSRIWLDSPGVTCFIVNVGPAEGATGSVVTTSVTIPDFGMVYKGIIPSTSRLEIVVDRSSYTVQCFVGPSASPTGNLSTQCILPSSARSLVGGNFSNTITVEVDRNLSGGRPAVTAYYTEIALMPYSTNLP